MDGKEKTEYHRTVTASFPNCLSLGVHPSYPCLSVFIRGPFGFGFPSVQPSLVAARRGLRDRAEAALAAVELADGGGEIECPEIGPHRAREHELPVGPFPQKEIAQPPLPARADQEGPRRTHCMFHP